MPLRNRPEGYGLVTRSLPGPTRERQETVHG
jgi:hypothetical protein